MFNKKAITFINHLLVSALIFAIPSNLFFILTEKYSYVHGLRIDYLLPKFYLSDIIVLALTAWIFLSQQIKLPKWKYKKNILLIATTFVFFAIQLLTKETQIVAWQIIKILEIIWLIFILDQIWPKLKPKLILISINLVLFFQSLIGILQFINQKSVAGYWLFGEPNLSKQIGLAKQIIFEQNLILPYGTTAHPNILGGFISILLIINMLLLKKAELKKSELFLLFFSSLFGLWALFLTSSWSAWLVIGAALLLSKINLSNKQLLGLSITGWLVSLILITQFGSFKTNNNQSLVRRQYLNQAAIMMFIDHPITGIGLNNFTTQVEKYSPKREVVRFSQPAHHTPLLILSEVGLLGIFVSIAWLIKLSSQWTNALALTCACVLPILVLDHYLVTLQTGNLLFGLLLVSLKNFSNPHLK